MGFALGSAMRIGRPTFEGFCFMGSSPRAVQMVAMRSGIDTGRSTTYMPSAEVLPMTWPPPMPPPHKAVDQAAGKWSRPPER